MTSLIVDTMNKKHHEYQNKGDKSNLCLIVGRNGLSLADAHVAMTKDER